jgi:hypothetical protein
LEVVDLSGNRIGEVKGLSGCGVLAFLNLGMQFSTQTEPSFIQVFFFFR